MKTLPSKYYLVNLGLTPDLANDVKIKNQEWYFNYKLPSQVTRAFLHDLAHLLQFKKHEVHYWINNTGGMKFVNTDHIGNSKAFRREFEVDWIDKTYLRKLEVKNLKLQKKYHKRWFKTKIKLVNKFYNQKKEFLRHAEVKDYWLLSSPIITATIQDILQDYTTTISSSKRCYTLKHNESLTQVIEATSACKLQTNILSFDPTRIEVIF